MIQNLKKMGDKQLRMFQYTDSTKLLGTLFKLYFFIYILSTFIIQIVESQEKPKFSHSWVGK
uniref:Uncharacterized protein n=1 Tax=Schistosoma mansoni TaxID=6183 RepID=A0A5K4F5Z7_SCHMA